MSGPTGVDDDDKLRNLWKQSRGVVDIHKENLYNNTSERPFVRQTLNKEIFSDDVPDSLGAVPPTWSGAPRQDQPDYSVENLDASFNTIFINTNNTAYGPNTTHSLAPIGYPHLTYYHQWEFKEFDTADQLSRPNGDVVATTWYIEDLSNNVIGREKSLARNTISFNKGGRGDYQQKFYIRDQTGNLVDVAELEDPYKFVFDNQTGFILIYANDALSPNWYLNSGANSVPPPTEGPLVGSFIRYTGAKGAAGGSGSGGGSSVGNINLVQVLELQNENLPYHPPFEDIGFGNFIPAKGMYYMPIANYVIASVDKTSALAMGHFTVKIKGPNYDLVFQFMASVVNGRNPTIKVLNSNLESQTDGWGNLIMYDDDANNKWRICLGFDETEKIPVGNPPSAPWTNVNPAGLPPPTWWINGGQSQQTFDYIRITLVNNNANQNNLTITPIAEGNWELSSESEFKDITLAPIHSITGLWTGQPGDLPNPLSINYTYRYKVISKLALSNIDPSGNIASDTAVNVFYKDIALAHNTKIGSWKFDTNSTNESQLAQVPPAGVGSGFWENVRTFETKYNKGDLALQGEKIQIDSKLLNIIGDVTTDGNITVDRNIETINGDIIHNTSTVITEVNYNNNNFFTRTANTGSGGTWQTIARTESFMDVHLRRATAIFEVFDKSNTIGNTAGVPVGGVFGERDPASVDDYILFSVSWYYDTYIGQSAINGGGFHDIDSNTGTIDPPRCTINVINSRCGTNFAPSGNMGYISSLRVETNFIRDALNGNHQAVAQIQIKRHSSGTLAGNQVGEGVTDVKVRMINNNEGINSNTLNWNLVSNDFQFTVPSSQNGSHILEFPLCKYDTNTGTLTDNNRTGVVSTSTVNGDLQSTYFDKLKTNYITEAENDIKILVDDDILAAQQPTFSNKIIIGNSNNETTHSISFFGGNTTTPLQSAVLNLNGNSGNGVKTGDLYYQNSSGDAGVGDTLINSVYTKGHYTDELCNPALVQPIKIDLTTAGLNVSDNDWITLAVVGKPSSSQRRASALFELSERSGGHQQSIIFRAGMSYSSTTTNEYDNQKNNYIEVISNIYYSEIRFLRLRIKYNSSASNTDGTTGTQTTRKIIYGGGVLQVQINGNANDPGPNPPAGSGLTPTPQPPNYLYLKIYQNTKNNGWVSNSSVIRNYSQNEDIPVYDTTYNGSNGTTGEIYTLDKTVSLTAKNHITTTQEKTFKFCGSGITVTNTDKYYLDTIEDSDSGWPSRPFPGSEIQIKLDRMGINMNKSTITHLWDIPQSWIRHITPQTNSNGDTVYEPNPEKVGGAFSSSGGHREGVAVSISTLQNYYQQMEQPFKLYRGGQASITGALSKTTLTNSYNFTDGFLAMLSEGPETSNNTKKANAIVYRNDFMDGVYNVGTSGMNLEWRTKFDWTNTEIVRGNANNGLNNTPYSFGLTGLDEFDATGNKFSSTGGWTWTNGTNQNNYIYVNTSQAAPENNYITFRGKTGHNNTTFSEYVNDSLFLAGEGRGFDLFGLRNKWHIMPQKNMSAYVLSAYLYIQHQSSSFSINFGGTPASAPHQVQFILCGTTFSTSSSGNNTIRELTTLATITNTNASNDTVNPSWSRLHDTGSVAQDNNWIRWYPNGGNGEFSKGIYIGRTYEQKFDSIVESDQRFDALSIRVKVRVRNTSSSFSATSVTIRGTPARLGFYISPLIRSVP